MLALVLAILIVSKRKDYKQIAKLGFIPSLFNISEPIMFGLPVVMNPVLIIPMILVTLVSLGIGTLATVTGFMGLYICYDTLDYTSSNWWFPCNRW